jgi:hypothetical protein
VPGTPVPFGKGHPIELRMPDVALSTVLLAEPKSLRKTGSGTALFVVRIFIRSVSSQLAGGIGPGQEAAIENQRLAGHERCSV